MSDRCWPQAGDLNYDNNCSVSPSAYAGTTENLCSCHLFLKISKERDLGCVLRNQCFHSCFYSYLWDFILLNNKIALHLAPCKLPHYWHLIKKYTAWHSPGLEICISKELKVDPKYRGSQRSQGGGQGQLSGLVRTGGGTDNFPLRICQAVQVAAFTLLRAVIKTDLVLARRRLAFSDPQTRRYQDSGFTLLMFTWIIDCHVGYKTVGDSLCDDFSLNYKAWAINPNLRGFLSSFPLVKCTSSIEPTLGHFKSITNKSVALSLSLIASESTVLGINFVSGLPLSKLFSFDVLYLFHKMIGY